MTTPRLEFLDPAQLADHPANWKFHPQDQLTTLGTLISELGWLKPLVYNQRTNRILDGHGRKAISSGAPVPVYVVDLAENLEPKALATLDPIGWTSVADKARYDALLKAHGLLESARDGVKSLMQSVSRAGTLLNKPPEEDRPIEERVDIPLNALWPSSNPWGVPDLLPELQAQNVPYPVETWGRYAHTRHMGGTWHFYTADRKFEPLWRNPDELLKSGPLAAVEPNFSTTDQQPLAFALWHLYRKRWLARYWQARGIRIFVDVNVDAGLLDRRPELGGDRPNLLGVPRGWCSYASRAHANDPRSLTLEWEIVREHAAPHTPTFLVVGGGDQVQALARANRWIWVKEHLQQVHGQPEANNG